MAERRMFAKTIVLSDAFLDLPMSARCLYFTLGMMADDDGFVNAPRSIMRQCGASDDDMKILISKKFVLLFDSGVIVIKHWRINNYLRNDRYQGTKYIDEKSQLELDEKGGYHKTDHLPAAEESADEHSLCAKDLRKATYAESDLPYSFDYKIRDAFSGKPCPICGYAMKNIEGGVHRPTIQHNIPISKGGKHELSNISVICHSCNVSLRDTQTEALNNAEVVTAWEAISGIPSSGIPNSGIPSIGKVSTVQGRLGEDSVGKDKDNNNTLTHSFTRTREGNEANLSRIAIMIRGYQERGWDTAGCYDLATDLYGLTREEVDAACRTLLEEETQQPHAVDAQTGESAVTPNANGTVSTESLTTPL